MGEGPGFQEDHKGEPFVGRSGKLLGEMIQTELGRKREEVYISNAVRCHPMTNPKTPEERGNDRPPKPEEIDACKPWWQAELDIVKPKVICLLGASALKAVVGKNEKFAAYRSKAFKSDRFCGAMLFVTYHPAAILRNPPLMESYRLDFKKLKKLLSLN